MAACGASRDLEKIVKGEDRLVCILAASIRLQTFMEERCTGVEMAFGFVVVVGGVELQSH